MYISMQQEMRMVYYGFIRANLKGQYKFFFVGSWGEIITSGNGFSNYGLDVNDYANLKFEDEPVEVFLKLKV